MRYCCPPSLQRRGLTFREIRQFFQVTISAWIWNGLMPKPLNYSLYCRTYSRLLQHLAQTLEWITAKLLANGPAFPLGALKAQTPFSLHRLKESKPSTQWNPQNILCHREEWLSKRGGASNNCLLWFPEPWVGERSGVWQWFVDMGFPQWKPSVATGRLFCSTGAWWWCKGKLLGGRPDWSLTAGVIHLAMGGAVQPQTLHVAGNGGGNGGCISADSRDLFYLLSVIKRILSFILWV